MRKIIAATGLIIFCLSACQLASHDVRSETPFKVKNTPDSVMVQYLLLINSGKYQESLSLFAFDVLERDGITLNYYSKYCDKNITLLKTIQSIKVVKVESEGDAKVVTFTIDYKYDDDRTTFMRVILIDNLWKITPVASLK